MGDVGSAIATPFVAVGTTITGQANKKVYYDCPRCGREVWVYAAGAAFVGRKCGRCRGESGPLDMGIIGDAVDVAITPITTIAALADNNLDGKVYYNCPKCGKQKYVSACAPHLKGKVCLDCNPLGERIVKSAIPIIPEVATIREIKKDSTQVHNAEFRGDIVYRQWYNKSDANYSNKFDLNDKIAWFETRSCRILHGSINWLLSGAGKAVGFDPIEHWWTTIKTENGNYYQIQFRNCHLIELRKCSSFSDCDQTGLAEASKESNADIFKEDGWCKKYSNSAYSIGDIIEWMKSHDFSAQWELTTHNCQDMCKTFHRKFWK